MKAGKIGLRKKECPIWPSQEVTLLKKLYQDKRPGDDVRNCGKPDSGMEANGSGMPKWWEEVGYPRQYVALLVFIARWYAEPAGRLLITR
jgi:hypothetical protein